LALGKGRELEKPNGVNASEDWKKKGDGVKTDSREKK